MAIEQHKINRINEERYLNQSIFAIPSSYSISYIHGEQNAKNLSEARRRATSERFVKFGIFNLLFSNILYYLVLFLSSLHILYNIYFYYSYFV